jgi:hypothetical protein
MADTSSTMILDGACHGQVDRVLLADDVSQASVKDTLFD